MTVNYKPHQFQLACEIFEREAPEIAYWESERPIDMVVGCLEQWESDGLRPPELMDWLRRFREDKRAATKGYWNAIHDDIRSAFRDGADPIPGCLMPG